MKLIDLKSTGIGILGQAQGTELSVNINGSKELNFVLPIYYADEKGIKTENFRWNYIQKESLIKLEYKDAIDWYVVKSFDEVRDTNGKLTSNIQCRHISNSLTQSGLDLFIDEESGTANYLLNMVLQDSDWSMGVVDQFFNEDLTEKIRTLSINRSNRYNAVQDIAELFNGYPIFNPDKTVDLKLEVGVNNGVVFRYGKNLKNITRTIGENDIITKLWVEGGNDDIGVVTITDVNPTGENYILNFDYFIQGGFLSNEQVLGISNFNTNIADVNENIKLALDGVTILYNDRSINDSLLESKKLIKASKQEALEDTDVEITNEVDQAKIQTLINYKTQLTGEISVLNTEINALVSEITTQSSNILTKQDQLDLLGSQKQDLIANFNLLMGNFIREGLWQDSNYVDSQALYEDAKEQSIIYSYPQVSYNLSILDLSVLTGYEIEKFNIGDIVRIIDEKVKIDTLGRVTEFTQNLDRPQDVSIQIGNFYSNFEDLFKKITQSAEVIKQRQQVYERAVGINPDGTINYEVLQKTFDNNVFSMLSGTNNKLQTDSRGITVYDMNNPLSFLRINAGGIYGTTTGEEGLKLLISAEGISGRNIISGILNGSILPIIPSVKIGDASISDAKILDLAVSKLTAGIIFSNKISVQSESGNLKLQDNTLKVWDNTGKERVSLGLNNDDYNLLVRGVDGETVLFGVDGVTKAGITEGSIDDSKVAIDANINAAKIDIDSVFTEMNDSTSLLKASKIKLDTEEQTLDVSFSELSEEIKQGGSPTFQQVYFTEATNTVPIEIVRCKVQPIIYGNTELINEVSTGVGSFNIISRSEDSSEEDIVTITLPQTIEYFNMLPNGVCDEIRLSAGEFIQRIGEDETGLIELVEPIMHAISAQTLQIYENGTVSLTNIDGTNLSVLPSKISFNSATNLSAKTQLENESLWINTGQSFDDVGLKQEELESAIITNSTSIEQTNNSIGLKVDSSEFNTYKENVNGEMQTVRSDMEVMGVSLNLNSEQIALKAERSEFDTLNNTLESVNTQLNTFADGVNIEITKIRDGQDQINRSFDFTEDGLKIAKSQSPLSLNLGDEITFENAGQVKVRINESEMAIDRLNVTSSIKIGSHQIYKYGSDLTIFKWVGGN